MHRLLDYVEVMVRWRRFLVLNTLAVCVLAIAVSFVLPSRYTAEATLLPPSDTDLLGLSTGGGMGFRGLAQLTGGLLSGSSSADLMIGVLRSSTVQRSVVERCSLVQRLRVRSGRAEDAVRALAKSTSLNVTDEGIVVVAFEARAPELAAQVANTYVEELDAFLRSSNVSSGRNMRVFVERRLREVEKSSAQAQESLRVFQERSHLLSIDDGVKAAMDAYAQLQSEYAIREIRLRSLQAIAGEDNPLTGALGRDVQSLRDQLRSMEQGNDNGGFGPGFGVSLAHLPSAAAEYLRRYRDVRVLEEAYVALHEQYEYARVLEARDTPALTVVDIAVPPDKRSFPRRWLIVAVALLFSLAYGVAGVFLAEYFRRLGTRDPEAHNRWKTVVSTLRSVLRPSKGSSGRGRTAG